MNIQEAITKQHEINDYLNGLHSDLCETNPLGAEYVRKFMEKAWEIESHLAFLQSIGARK